MIIATPVHMLWKPAILCQTRGKIGRHPTPIQLLMQLWSRSPQICSNRARLWLGLVEVGPILAEVGRLCPTSNQLDQVRPSSPKTSGISTAVSPLRAESSMDSTLDGPDSAKFRAISIDDFDSRFGEMWRGIDESGAMSAEFAPSSADAKGARQIQQAVQWSVDRGGGSERFTRRVQAHQVYFRTGLCRSSWIGDPWLGVSGGVAQGALCMMTVIEIAHGRPEV